MNQNICKLCLENLADSQESHIIPKFFTKSIFFGGGKHSSMQTIKIKNKILGCLDTKPSQGGIKESYLFCKGCENYFAELDTYFCNNIYAPIRNKEKFFEDFEILLNRYKSIVCKNASVNMVDLFIFSIIFRCKVSNHDLFKIIKIDSINNNKIRKCLIDSKMYTFHERKKNTSELTNYFFGYLLIIQEENNNPKSNFVSVHNKLSEDSCVLILNDFILTFYFRDNKKPFAESLNDGINNIQIVCLSEIEFDSIKSTDINNALVKNKRN